MVKVAVLGAGSWGTALASACAAGAADVVLWARDPLVAAAIQSAHCNPRYLSDARLPDSVQATSDLRVALNGAEVVLFVVPSAGMRTLLEQVAEWIPERALIAHAVKGFDPLSRRTMSELISVFVPGAGDRMGVLAGPSHAEEVMASLPTTLVAAAYRRATAERLQDLLMSPVLRVYTNPDVKGAELGGALKNIIALGVGIADGLGFGDNARAALMTRGLTEITRLGVQLGASMLTFSGLSGVGDLIVTCTSRHSRNYRAGRLLGEGASLDEALAAVGMVVEGVATTRIAVELARTVGVEMPISEALYRVLFDGEAPRQAVEKLMSRDRAHEVEEVAAHQVFAQWEPADAVEQPDRQG